MTRSCNPIFITISSLKPFLFNDLINEWRFVDDYRVLEVRRVVELQHSHGDQYYMRLLKREIGELAYEVISLGEAAESSLILRGAAVSRYTRPEETRSAMRKTQNRESRRATADILTALRTGAR